MQQINEIKRMQQLAGVISESQLNETKEFSIPDILKGKHTDSNNPSNTIEDYKPNMKVVVNKFYGSKEELDQQYGTVTGMSGGKVQVKKLDGKAASYSPEDLVIVTGQATESQLSEAVPAAPAATAPKQTSDVASLTKLFQSNTSLMNKLKTVNSGQEVTETIAFILNNINPKASGVNKSKLKSIIDQRIK